MIFCVRGLLLLAENMRV